MINVLFVCLGNICRSPMAEAIFRHIVQAEGLSDNFFIASAGTSGWHVGEPPHRGTQDILRRNNIYLAGKTASQLHRDDINKYQYIIAMDSENVTEINHLYGKLVPRLLDYTAEVPNSDVPDPYYTGEFHQVYQLIIAGCRGLLKAIREQEGI